MELTSRYLHLSSLYGPSSSKSSLKTGSTIGLEDASKSRLGMSLATPSAGSITSTMLASVSHTLRRSSKFYFLTHISKTSKNKITIAHVVAKGMQMSLRCVPYIYGRFKFGYFMTNKDVEVNILKSDAEREAVVTLRNMWNSSLDEIANEVKK